MRKTAVVLLLAWAAVAQDIPTPASHFGHAIGVDRELLDWDKVVTYFQALQATSDKIAVRELGKTTEGRPFIAATIGSPETIRNLSHYLDIQTRLADPRKTTPPEADRFIAEGKTIVLITCSIHATEVASTHTAVEFAYRLLTQDTPRFREILNNTILILVPSLNPDGVDIVTRWYRQTLGTPYEGSSPPELYQKYVGHDNNRDWYIFSQPETRLAVSRLHNVWHPQIVYDVHQQGPYASRMFVPPWMDPVDPNIDPIIAQECNSIGSAMASDLTAAGKKGVVINALYDFWTASRHYQAYHAGLRILSESASAALASPLLVKPEQIVATAPGYNPRERSWNYLEPWEGGAWRLRDIIDYQSIAFESLLYQAAIQRATLLRNFYTVGRRAVERTSPYAFVIPGRQFDPGSARKMLETLAFGLVEISRASDDFNAGGKHYSAGSYIIPMQQPYGSYAKTLLERQHYPDLRAYPGGPPKRPYDVTAQTLPLLMGVEVDAIEAPFQADASRVSEFPFELDRPKPPANGLPASDVDSWREVTRIWRTGAPIYRDTLDGTFYPLPVASSTVRDIPKPRIGLYKSFMPIMDEGWTRWLLENFGFDYTSVQNPDIEAGGLRRRFDAIVFPDQPPASITEGYHQGAMPPQYAGGLSDQAAEHLKEFVTAGGTLLFLNHSTSYALSRLGVDAKNVLEGVPDRDFYSPGSILNSELDPASPLTYGVPQTFTVWNEGSPAWELQAGSPARAVSRYPKNHVLASGWLLGEKHVAGQSNLVDVPMGSGHIVLFGMRPQYRAQSYQDFKLFFNALVLRPSS